MHNDLLQTEAKKDLIPTIFGFNIETRNYRNIKYLR